MNFENLFFFCFLFVVVFNARVILMLQRKYMSLEGPSKRKQTRSNIIIAFRINILLAKEANINEEPRDFESDIETAATAVAAAERFLGVCVCVFSLFSFAFRAPRSFK